MEFGKFIIAGPKVQGVGYRPFLVSRFPDFRLEGRVWNAASGLAVDVEVYGMEEDIVRLYEFARKNKPKGAEVGYISKPSISKAGEVPFLPIITQTGYLTVEQLSKGIGVQKKLPKEIAKAIRSSV